AGRGLAARALVVGEDRYECLRERAFGKHAAQDIRQAERRFEGIHLQSGAETDRLDALAHQSGDARQQGQRADGGERPQQIHARAGDTCRGIVSKGGDLRTWCADAKSFFTKSSCRRDGRTQDGEACERFDPRIQRRWTCHESAIRLARIAENRYYARSFSTAPASSEGRR